MTALNDVKCHDRQNCSFYNFCTYFPELFSLQGCYSITPSLQQLALVMKILSNVRVARSANNVEETDSMYFFLFQKLHSVTWIFCYQCRQVGENLA